ncbi:diacylglycerol kinase family protein [Candidatus Wolfebacteria bacterium]|nr:diacylglycerol kinase family protein [Candidatus Wolfebacteria bacterium]
MKKFTNGFKAAFHGIKETLKQERNFKFMIIIAVVVIFLMFYFPTTKDEKVALLIAAFSVLTLELMNSTIERIMNFLHPEPDERIKAIKDLTAGIVLVASIGAAIIGTVIFWPYLK